MHNNLVEYSLLKELSNLCLAPGSFFDKISESLLISFDCLFILFILDAKSVKGLSYVQIDCTLVNKRVHLDVFVKVDGLELFPEIPPHHAQSALSHGPLVFDALGGGIAPWGLDGVLIAAQIIAGYYNNIALIILVITWLILLVLRL
jgi:hypothetical protein